MYSPSMQCFVFLGACCFSAHVVAAKESAECEICPLVVDDLDASIRHALPGATMVNTGFRKGPDGKRKQKLRPEPQTDEAFMKLLQGGEESGVCGAGAAFQSMPRGSQLTPHDRTQPWWAALEGAEATHAMRIHQGPASGNKARKVEKALRKDIPRFKKLQAKCESFVNEHEAALIGSVMEWAREERAEAGHPTVFVTPNYEAKRLALCEQTACKAKKHKKAKLKKGEL